MKTVFSMTLILSLCGVAGAQGEKADPVGTWKCEYEISGAKLTSTLTITKDGDKIAGTMSWPNQKETKLKDVKLKQGELSFSAVREIMGEKIPVEYKFAITGDKLKGKAAAEFGGMKQDIDIEGKREKLAEKSSAGTAQRKPKQLVVVQVRNEVHLPGRSSSDRVEDYSSIVKDGWYQAADGLFRVRIPGLQSGKINVLRRRWEDPDGIDVAFVDEDAYSRAVFSYEPNLKPAHEALKDKYLEYFATQKTKSEAKVIATRFGDTVEVVAMNWVTTRDYPYDPPTIDTSKERIAKTGPTVGIGWTFWRGQVQCGCWIIMPVDRKLDEAKAFQHARGLMKDFAEGVEFPKKKQ